MATHLVQNKQEEYINTEKACVLCCKIQLDQLENVAGQAGHKLVSLGISWLIS